MRFPYRRPAALLLAAFAFLLATAAQAQTAPDASPDLQLERLTSGNYVPGSVLSTLRQPDGKLLVGGVFDRVGGSTPRSGLLRLERDGSLDADFAPVLSDGNVEVRTIAMRGDAIYIGGLFGRVGGVATPSVARLDRDGQLASGWASPFADSVGNEVNALVVTANGLYIGGDLLDGDAWGLIRADAASGARDAGWVAQTQYNPTATPSAGNRGEIYALAAVGDDLLAGGQFGQIAGIERVAVARLSQAAPVVVRAFDAHIAAGNVAAFALDGARVYLGGNFFRDDVQISYLNRVAVDSGAIDPGWAPDINGSVGALHALVGMLYVGGSFSDRPPGGARLARVPMAGNGSVDASWNPHSNDSVYTIADSCHGQLLVGGTFVDFAGTPRNGFAGFAVPQFDCLFDDGFERR